MNSGIIEPRFEHGYALLIGVNDNLIDRLRLPIVAKDIAALAQVLSHPERCAYPTENVKVLQGTESTRAGILAGLSWLRDKIKSDPNATAVVYYSGHGHCDDAVQPSEYYLLPYDTDEEQLRLRSLPAKDFAREIEAIQPQRLLVLLDCCHAGGADAKDIDTKDIDSTPLNSAAIPAVLFMMRQRNG